MNQRTLFPAFLHGGDYNPDQWLDYPEILEKDVELMKEAHINCVSLGIFAWAKMEPREGDYQLDWMAEIIDRLYKNGIYTILATPSGAKPMWMSEKYPEIRRVSGATGHRELSGNRHNHCYTSPIYREKVRQINTVLAERFSHHPGVILWHVSNEYGGECHCELCQQAFRDWLREKYGTIEALNHAWWADFWSHTYSDFSQITSPMVGGEHSIHGLTLDWKRFVTHQTVDFMRAEIAAVRAVNPDLPVTTNMMGWYDGLNYYKFAPYVNIVSWDNYPRWHTENNVDIAADAAAAHDIMRSVKRAPWLLMESTPSMTNWQPTSTLKRPGMHMTSSLQAVAHGSDSVQYFQWRKGRGSFEKFHGAVVDHYGGSDTRVFRDVAAVGSRLEAMKPLLETEVRPQVAVVYDVENRWALEDSAGPRRAGIGYTDDVHAWHRAFWVQGISVDMIDMECDDLSRYKIIAAPMLYMYRAGFEQKLRTFVENGGVLIGTYNTGIVNDTDLCYLGGWPGETMDLFGVWNEEIDSLPEGAENAMVFCGGDHRRYTVHDLCAILHAKGAEVLAEYGDDFYKGTPALTVNRYGSGQAYYVAARAGADFLRDFCTKLADEAGITRALNTALPYGVVPMMRTDETGKAVVFVQNFTGDTKPLVLNETCTVFETGEKTDALTLAPYETVILLKETT